jgi:hypothetical protein
VSDRSSGKPIPGDDVDSPFVLPDPPFPYTVHDVPFHAARSAESELTFGQYYIWDIINRLSPFENLTNMLTLVEVPESVSLDQVLAAIQAILERHDSLRTRYRRDEHGEPRQVLHKDGILPVRVLDTHGRELAPDAYVYAEGFRATRYDLQRDWPVRLSVFVDRDRPVGVLIGMTHMASDIRGMQVLREEMSRILERGSVAVAELPPPGRQPLEQVIRERTAEFAHDESRSFALWRARLQKFPDPMFGELTNGPQAPRYWEGALHSPSIRLAAEAVAQRYDLTVPAVIVTAVSYCLARAAGRPDCALTIRALNRIDDEVLNAVGHFTEDMAMYLDLRQRSFEDAAGDALVAAIETYTYGRYHPTRLWALIDELNREHGTNREIDTAFDCTPLRPGTETELKAGTMSGAELEAAFAELAAQTSFRWEAKREHELIKCFVRSWGDDLLLLVDTAYIDHRLVEPILRGVERLLVGYACGAGDVVSLMHDSGIPTP